MSDIHPDIQAQAPTLVTGPQAWRVPLEPATAISDRRALMLMSVSELIVDNCPGERLAELWKWQRALEDDAAAGSVDDYFWHNVGFRLVEVGLSGNGELQRTLHTLGLRTLQFRHLSLSQPGQVQRSLADHRRLLMAYEERDKTAATGMTRALIMGGYRAIQRSGLVGADAPPVRFRPGPGAEESDPAEREGGAAG